MLLTLVRHTRRSHAVEHATIHVLSRRHPEAAAGGVSGPRGFWLYTPLPLEEIAPAVLEALQRMQAGETNLRLHPNCGTNLLVTATLTATATLLGSGGKDRPRSWSDKLDFFSGLVMFNMLALIAARPLGTWTQAHLTTSPHVQGTKLVSVARTDRPNVYAVRLQHA